MNPLQNIPAAVRRVLYIAYGLVALAYLVLAAFYDKDPSWVEGIGRVIGALSVPFGALAASNVVPTNTAQVVAPGSVTVLPDSRNPEA